MRSIPVPCPPRPSPRSAGEVSTSHLPRAKLCQGWWWHPCPGTCRCWGGTPWSSCLIPALLCGPEERAEARSAPAGHHRWVSRARGTGWGCQPELPTPGTQPAPWPCSVRPQCPWWHRQLLQEGWGKVGQSPGQHLPKPEHSWTPQKYPKGSTHTVWCPMLFATDHRTTESWNTRSWMHRDHPAPAWVWDLGKAGRKGHSPEGRQERPLHHLPTKPSADLNAQSLGRDAPASPCSHPLGPGSFPYFQAAPRDRSIPTRPHGHILPFLLLQLEQTPRCCGYNPAVAGGF